MGREYSLGGPMSTSMDKAQSLLDNNNDPLLAEETFCLYGLSSTALTDHIDLIRATATNDAFPGLILPRVTIQGIIYYFAAFSIRQWRRQAPLVEAFAGITVTMPASLDPADHFDRALMTLGFAELSKRIVPGNAPNLVQAGKLALRAIYRMAKIVMECPVVAEERRVSLSELLDDFELALADGDTTKCDTVIEQLTEGAYLDRLNILFLKARLFAGMGQWHELVSWQGFGRLCQTRRPGRISTILINALYLTKLADLGEDVGALVKRFQEVIMPVSGTLFRVLPHTTDENVLCAFAIHALATHQNLHWSKLSEFAREEDLASFTRLWEACRSHADDAHPSTPEPPKEEGAIPKVIAIRNAISLAFTEDCPEKARLAMEQFALLSRDEQSEVLAVGKVRDMWHYLSAILVGNWTRCFDLLCTGSDSESAITLMDAFNSWSADEQLAGHRNAAHFLELLEKSADDTIGSTRLIANLQPFVTWVMEDPGFPREEAVPVYVFLLELYALSERKTQQRLESFSGLMEMVLSCELDGGVYERVIEASGILVEETRAHKAVDWMIDLVGTVLDNHSPSPQRREELLWIVLNTIKSLGVELAQWQRESLSVLLRALQQNIDVLGDLPVSEHVSPLTHCANKSIAIYTLNESAGKRVQDILEEVCPTAKVAISTDKSSNSGLKHLAKNADIFIVAWRSAKHAATIDIKQNRPNALPTLYPSGKGTSSILRELETHLQKSS